MSSSSGWSWFSSEVTAWRNCGLTPSVATTTDSRRAAGPPLVVVAAGSDNEAA
ncbi:hypothetical protein [Segeticoccus rhizosphaerae]|uniref:hypothetical protein n=1 Tax=Segeticoccus rhizosphaerae TaxID=1104777 RepID=UPI001EE44920|nr:MULTISPECIES: hypothetical protein [Intrasporangiaceae]